MTRFTLTALAVLLAFCLHTNAQTEPTHHRKPLTARQKLIPNTIKLELVYKGALVTQYNNNGGSRSYNVFVPFVRINDAKPVEIDKHGDFLRQYFTKCNEADQQLDDLNAELHKASLFYWGGLGLGAGIMGFGLAKTVQNSGNGAAVFFTSFGIAAATMATGVFMAYKHVQKADEHLRLSVDIYNSRCYKPSPSDTARPDANAPVKPSPIKIYRDTTLFQLIRNEPAHSGMFGISLDPVMADIYGLNLGFSGGISAFYTYESLVGCSVSYQRAYLDDLKGNSRSSVPGGDAESFGIPANYSKSSLLEFLVKLTTFSWQKESGYQLHLGRTRMGRMPAEVVGNTKGQIFRAITVRMGYQSDNRLIESESGLKYVNTTPEYTYNYQGQQYPLPPTNLSTSSTMVKSGVIVAGVGLTTFRDLKINLLDDTYTGRREQKSQWDLYADALYAQSLAVEDMIYYHAIEPVTGEYMHLPQRLNLSNTPVNKLGFRVGVQAINMLNAFFGLKTLLEVGKRSGPQSTDKNDSFYFKMGFGLVFGGRISNTH